MTADTIVAVLLYASPDGMMEGGGSWLVAMRGWASVVDTDLALIGKADRGQAAELGSEAKIEGSEMFGGTGCMDCGAGIWSFCSGGR